MEYILDNDFTPDQRRNRRYCCDPEHPSNQVRSLHDAILRNHLGNKNTAQHIYQHGLPDLLKHQHGIRHILGATAAEHHSPDQPAKNLCEAVQPALAEAILWPTALAWLQHCFPARNTQACLSYTVSARGKQTSHPSC